MNAPQHLRVALLLVLSFVLLLCVTGCATTTQTFSSSDKAADSLITALRANDQKQLHEILGPDADNILDSGDAIADQNNTQAFLKAYDEKHGLEVEKNGDVTLVVGNSDWPMPIPIVKNDWNRWYFDLAAGKEEILNRRIGRNELDAINVALAVVDAQREYSAADPEHVGQPVYAQKFLSDPGQKNGLYWETKDGEKPSPLGPGIDAAAGEGYTFKSGERAPYHGYYYHILKSQGPSAPGGAFDYVKDGKMTGGFAVVAYPASYGDSGISTFIVNQTGIVYSADLGPDTGKLGQEMTTYDPDQNWKPVEGSTMAVDQK